MSDAAAAATGAEGDTDGAGATADTAPVRRWLGRWPAGPTGAGHPVRQAGGWRLGAVGLAVLGLLVGTLVLFGASLTVALHSTQSYHFNLNWTAAFRDALAAGELYPRWLPSMWGGAGGPDFFFYAPMPYFLAAGLGGLAGAPDWQALALAGWAMHAAAALGMLHLGHRLGLGLWPALAMAAVYSVLPYHLIVWNERGALGEAAACVALAPAVAATIDTLGRGRGHWRLTLSVAFLGLSHLPALLIAATGCGAVALAMWRQWTPARVAAAGLAAILGLGLAAVYWVPAVALMDSVQADVMLTYSWREHLLQPASFDASAFLDRILMLALALTLLAVAMLALLWPRAGRLAEGTPDTPAPVAATPVGAATVGALLVGTAILLMSPLATLLWAATPLERIQFPWRFLLLTDLGVAVLAGAGVAAFRAAGAWRRAGLGLAALALGGIALAGQARVLTHGPKAPLYPALLELRSGPPEWLGADRGFFTATTLLAPARRAATPQPHGTPPRPRRPAPRR
ncbi:MAG: hypothetical protein AAF677_10105, partial [Pseudomonadota bacterium]